MREDYLWDRSGEPDPEIAELEERLGRLRFQPGTLELPSSIVGAPRRSRYFPGLAAAAAILLFVLAGGLWLGKNRAQKDATTPLVIVDFTPGLSANLRPFAVDPDWLNLQAESNLASSAPSLTAAARAPRTRGEGRATQTLTTARAARTTTTRRDEQLIREGELAKDQVIMALHYASSKLNLVQKKIQANKDSGPTS